MRQRKCPTVFYALQGVISNALIFSIMRGLYTFGYLSVRFRSDGPHTPPMGKKQ